MVAIFSRSFLIGLSKSVVNKVFLLLFGEFTLLFRLISTSTVVPSLSSLPLLGNDFVTVSVVLKSSVIIFVVVCGVGVEVFGGDIVENSRGNAEKRGMTRVGGGLKELLPNVEFGVVDAEMKVVGRRQPRRDDDSFFSNGGENVDSLLAIGADFIISVDW